MNDKTRKTWIREQAQFEDAGVKITTNKWKWSGHVARLKDDRYARGVPEWRPYEVRSIKERPDKRCMDDFAVTVGKYWLSKAQDRNFRRIFGEAYIRYIMSTR